MHQVPLQSRVRDDFRNIFVGRQGDLILLSSFFEDRANDEGPPKVLSYLNAPGVGKTTLLKRFGRMIERERRGIVVYFTCRGNYRSERDVATDLLHVLRRVRDEKMEIMVEGSPIDREEIANRLSQLDFNIQENEISLNRVTMLILSLASILPVFLVTDEVQVLEGITEGESPLLRTYATFLSGLLSHRILLAISGTQYTILSRIGHRSPLNGKIEHVVIAPLKDDDISAYIDELRSLYPELRRIHVLEGFLKSYSGGHPRTIEIVVREYIQRGEPSAELLLNRVERAMYNNILDTSKRKGIRDLQSKEGFNKVKEWIVTGLTNNLHLYEMEDLDVGIDLLSEIISELMNIGIIVQNGNSDYYITSYFHAKALLENLTGEFERFLYEVYSNALFAKLVGSHSGFGYTFENIILSSISDKNVPFDISGIASIKTVNLSKLEDIPEMELGVFYHLPMMEDVDGIFRTGDTLVLLQLTTTSSGLTEKLRRLDKIVRELTTTRERMGRRRGEEVESTRGWFISLYDFRHDPMERIVVTSGSDLSAILGEEIYKKLVRTKEKLSQLPNHWGS